MRLFLAALVATVFGMSSAAAASRDEVDRLIGLLGLPEIMEIMALEGEGYGADLREDLLGGASSTQWTTLIDTLYAPEAMMQSFRPRFVELMADVEAAPLLEFFDSVRGRRIISLEIEARRAMLDDDIEAAAVEKLERMQDEADPRLTMLESYVDANELVENNVVGALNSSYAFYAGLAAGQALGGQLTEDQILADVWSQEPEIRRDTVEWVYAFLALAYRPLEDEDLRAYTALSETESGQAMNRALFDAFDRMYVTISEGLGRGAAHLMSGQDI